MRAPTVSVVIATYNRGPKITKTLDSVLAQTFRADEIIVIDDGSTDSTAAWVRTHYPEVSVASFSNGGTSIARNRGAAIARGDVLAFLDHDDEMRPEAIETLLQLLAQFPQARAAFADHSLRNSIDGSYFSNHHSELRSFHRMRTIETLASYGHARLYGRAMYHALLRGNLLQQPWAIYRHTFAMLGGFDAGIRYCEDWELFLRVADRVPLAVSDQVIGNHYLEGTNLSQRAGQQEWHMKVLWKQIRAVRWKDPKALVVLRRRLAMYYKGAGDDSRQRDPRRAWQLYMRSLLLWPFDHVVAARCFAWSYGAVRGRR
jgi:glycosyltransferase involved in cell wall biosynthesis